MSDPLSDRQESMLRSASLNLVNDTDELPQQLEGAWGELDEDHPKLSSEQVESQLQSYDRTDVSDDN